MHSYLQPLADLINAHEGFTEVERQQLMKALNDADKHWAITDFKLDRTEKVKRTTAILLEEESF